MCLSVRDVGLAPKKSCAQPVATTDLAAAMPLRTAVSSVAG
jgi:hypothetical protein